MEGKAQGVDRPQQLISGMDLKERLQAALGSAYTIERELGGGGMSRVFVAHESALGRPVVVKILGLDLMAGISAERFAREVRLAASLQHPNIVPVLTTGVADDLPYYTMPYVKGESLRARLHETPPVPMRQAVSILRDVARALQYAHGEGVVHRDIKPDNVLLAGDAAVVTDFGIAKAISAARTATPEQVDTPNPTTLTQAGSSIGTPAYMSPEQVAGDPVDNRTDIYAWCIVAYELLSGAHPFASKSTSAQLMAAHLSETPVALRTKVPGIPPALSGLVMQTLSKSREDRPASAAELLENLDTARESQDTLTPPVIRKHRSLFLPALAVAAIILAAGAYAYSRNSSESAAAEQISSVAVLPFAHERADSAEEYFGEGIADELMTALAKVPGLRVASRTSAIALGKRSDLDVREIADRLGVATVVEGTVRKSGGHLRVTAQLTNARDGLTLWSDAYDRESKDVFAVQSAMTRAIVATLRPNDTRNTEQKGPGTSDPDAYDLYMRGQYLVERRGPGVAKAADYFSQAIERDPNFARAYASLSAALELIPYFGGVPAYKVEERARATAERALQLDPSLAEPRVALAMTHWHANRWDNADREFKQAIAADSTSAVARTQYGRYLLTSGRVPEATAQLRVARMLDPLAATSSVWLSYGLAASGDKVAAAEESKRSRDLDPNLITNRTILVLEMVQSGRFKEALSVIGDVVPPTPFNGMTAYNLEKAGDKTRAAAIRRMLDAMSDTTWLVHTARSYAYLATTDTAKALSEMESAVAHREIMPQHIPFVDRVFDPVRHSPRFTGVVSKFGLDGHGLTSAALRTR